MGNKISTGRLATANRSRVSICVKLFGQSWGSVDPVKSYLAFRLITMKIWLLRVLPCGRVQVPKMSGVLGPRCLGTGFMHDPVETCPPTCYHTKFSRSTLYCMGIGRFNSKIHIAYTLYHVTHR